MPYLSNIGSAATRLLNAMLGGRPSQSLSARLGYARAECGFCRWACRVLTWIFRDGDHCAEAMQWDRDHAACELESD